MKTMTCEWKLAAVMLLADNLVLWGTRLQYTARQYAAVRGEHQARRLEAACRNERAARCLTDYQSRREAYRAGQILR